MCKCCKRCPQEEVLSISHLVTAASLVLTLQEGNKSFLESHFSKAPQHLCPTETNLKTKQVNISTGQLFSKFATMISFPQPVVICFILLHYVNGGEGRGGDGGVKPTLCNKLAMLGRCDSGEGFRSKSLPTRLFDFLAIIFPAPECHSVASKVLIW